MSRQLEQNTEDREARRHVAIARAVDGGLSRGVSRQGGELVGLTVKLGFHDCLIVLKADFPGGPMVSFVGSESLGGAFIKAVRTSNSAELTWREDRFRKGEG